MSDLGPRVAVAAVGIPAVLALLYVGGWVLGVPLAVLAGLGAREVYSLAEARGLRPFRGPGVLVAGALVLAAVARPGFVAVSPWALGLAGGLLAWTLTSALWSHGPRGDPLPAVSSTLFGAVYCGLGVAFVPLLHALPSRLAWGGTQPSGWAGPMVVALPLAATWVGDAAAYLAGTAWGRARLLPEVSPKKSWVGAGAGVVTASLASMGWLVVARPVLPAIPIPGLGAAAGMGGLLGVAAILGDLVESLLKREAGVKDSGSVFPGHGGVLDRLDALVATFPLAYVLLAALDALA